MLMSMCYDRKCCGMYTPCASFRAQMDGLALGLTHVLLLRIAPERSPATCLKSWWAAGPLQLDALLKTFMAKELSSKAHDAVKTYIWAFVCTNVRGSKLLHSLGALAKAKNDV